MIRNTANTINEHSCNTNTLRNILSVFLVLMSIQILPIEGSGTSLIKIMGMMSMTIIMLLYAPIINKAVILGSAYLLFLTISIIVNIETFRAETVLYRFVSVLAFISFYNIVYYKQVFSLDYFIRLIKGLIVAFVVVLIIQQFLKISFIGYSSALWINLAKLDRNILAVNSLSLEPSHSARILGALAIVLMRLYKCLWGEEQFTIKNIWRDFKWGVIGLIWAFLSMASGTAIIALFLVVLTMIKKRYSIIILTVSVSLFVAIPHINYPPVQRVYKAMSAATTLNRENIQEADLSASARILPFIYTIEHFDLSKKETWIGHGIDTGVKNDKWSTKRMIGDMTDYGLIQYIFALGLIFTCCIKRFLSVETLFFIILLMAEVRNIYVWWSIFMLFSISKYFLLQKEYILLRHE